MICTTILAIITMYGATGGPMSNGQMPFVGAAACPRIVPRGTIVDISGEKFVCADHTAKKYDGRFDLFSAGTKQDMLDFGKKRLPVTICT